MAVVDGRERYGKYLEDFKAGDVYKHWPGKTITEAENHQFCLLTMNHNPLHIDHKYMESHQHGKPLVVGLLVVSIAVGMSVIDTSGKAVANLEYEKITHDGPVFHGDTIYSETEVLDVKPTSKGDRGIIYVETRAHNQNGVKVLTLRRRFLVPRRA
ncbi:MAG: MaoC family dehydratase [Chloroflexi bacterium]|nr:MaoC family dehydratase [Chloroflexota bacterium]